VVFISPEDCGFDKVFPAGLCHPTRDGLTTFGAYFPAQATRALPKGFFIPDFLSPTGRPCSAKPPQKSPMAQSLRQMLKADPRNMSNIPPVGFSPFP
jgi:hypothetical protein